MAVHEIARRLIGGVWRTVDVEEDGGGNGGSLPDEWTVGADGDLTIENTGPDPGIVVAPTDPTTDDLAFFLIPATYVNDSSFGNLLRAGFDAGDPAPGSNVFTVALNTIYHVAAAGEGNGSLVLRAVDHPNDTASLDSAGSLTLQSESSDVPSITLLGGSNRQVFRANNAGVFFTSAHTAPADGTLTNGEVALWFDQTDGAAKLMIKGKSADGTVVTGEVALV